MNWKFLISYFIIVFLVNYIINDFKRDKAKKAKFECSNCKVRGCRGHYCANNRDRVLVNGEAQRSSAKQNDAGNVTK